MIGSVERTYQDPFETSTATMETQRRDFEVANQQSIPAPPPLSSLPPPSLPLGSTARVLGLTPTHTSTRIHTPRHGYVQIHPNPNPNPNPSPSLTSYRAGDAAIAPAVPGQPVSPPHRTAASARRIWTPTPRPSRTRPAATPLTTRTGGTL